MSDIDNQLPQTVHYPSAVLPAPPEFDLDLPADWEVGQVPGVLLAAGPSTSEGPFRSNVTVSAGLVGRDVDPVEIARSYVTGFAEGTYEIIDLDHLDEDTAQLVVQVQIAEPAIAVLQSIVVIKVDNRPADSELVSVLTVTASSDVERGEIDGPILASIISSMRISIPAEV